MLNISEIYNYLVGGGPEQYEPVTSVNGPGPHSKFASDAISFRSIRETGVVPTYDNESDMNYRIDFEAEDELMDALDTVRKTAGERIQNSQELQILLDKQEWTPEDRVTWEREVSMIVSEEVDKIPGLDSYRTSTGSKFPGVERFSDLNELSQDIGAGTHMIEFDCEATSIVEGLVLQQIEDETLPADGEEPKRAMEYRYIEGNVKYFPEDDISNHAYILAPSGNIIEGSADPSRRQESYREVIGGDGYGRIMEGDGAVAAQDSYGDVDVYGRRFDEEQGSQAFESASESMFGARLAEAQAKTGQFAAELEAYRENPAIRNAESTIEAAKAEGRPLNAAEDRMIHDTLGEEPLHRQYTEMSFGYGDMKDAWDRVFESAGDDPDRLAQARDALQQSMEQLPEGYENVPRSRHPLSNRTIGEDLGKWSEEHISKAGGLLPERSGRQGFAPTTLS